MSHPGAQPSRPGYGWCRHPEPGNEGEHLSSLLKSHEARTTNQVAVLTVTTLPGESIEEFAIRVFDKWRLGQKKKDNGVLVIVAAWDRRMRIEVGYGL